MAQVAGTVASATAQRFIAYERVSTARQGASGLGLEAQRHSIDAFAQSRGAIVLARFTEVESGKTADRPELAKAMHLSRITGAVLIIAKLDRLSRNAAFLLALRDSGVRFLAVDIARGQRADHRHHGPGGSGRTRGNLARTKEALAVAKARGVKLGNPNGAAALKRAGKGAVALRAAVVANADAHAQDLRAVVEALRADGVTSLRGLAEEMNRRGMRTRRGGQWQVSNVGNLLLRLKQG